MLPEMMPSFAVSNHKTLLADMVLPPARSELELGNWHSLSMLVP
jgi:hypothetical protein